MVNKLLIVESTAKSARIAKMLGSGWRVEATRGHVRDLPQDKLGIEVNQDFRPLYEVQPRQANTVRRLLKAIREAESVYVATDLDREGEAIAWHVLQLADLPPDKPVYRVAFTAIIESAVKAAIASPRPLDLNLIEAQQTRRIVDRLVGYLVSPLACQALDGRYSAGRVQSACLRLVVERERQIAAFTPETYWTLDAQLAAGEGEFNARLYSVKGQRVERLTHEQVDTLTSGLKNAALWIGSIRHGEQIRHPAPPFTTSTLQQAASQALGLSPERTMQVAQRLYEAGQITYHRTDGADIAPEAQDAARRLIALTYGGDYVPNEPQIYLAKSKHAQEAHEAIRPTDVTRLPQDVKGDGAELYGLIWRRFVASQMASARYAVQVAEVLAGKTHGLPYPLSFQVKGRMLVFDGFLKIYQDPPDPDAEPEENPILPPLSEGAALHLIGWLPVERQTQAPPRFTEASLVRELERLGIGRPSTYASMVQTLKQRGYVTVKSKRLVPSKSGVSLCDFLTVHFPDLFAAGYTAHLENELDAVASGRAARLDILRAFWSDFTPQLHAAGEVTQATKSPQQSPIVTGETCPACGGDLVERKGKHGKFTGCANYPDCGYTRGLEHKPVTLHGATS
ncbi:MAG TPA: type I DNA topoisomerase [Aggregatilinea sp.]|uniref:type I DNA topoisomerase n=1 Tax=Aggregatilinea sp. TaxID=2806333 RepID=UPI002C78DC0A|nr:type I DNA topoisomerase [Aggregatilinea sp.]HML20999.1 type I DNA topoisomerase [Aggregatilinea sp.]